MRSMALVVGLAACSGDDGGEDKSPSPDTTVDGDADTDTDTDSDTDTDHTATTVTSGAAGGGPMAPGWYRMYSLYFYDFNVPSQGGGRDSGNNGRHTGNHTGSSTPSGFWPRYVAFGANFGFDGDGNMVTVDAGPYGALPPTFWVQLVTDAYLDGDTSDAQTCTYEIPLDGAWTEAPIQSGGRLWWGFEWTGTEIGGNCDTLDWPVDDRYFGDPRTDWPGTGIGFAVGDPTSAVVATLGGAIDEDYLLGGTFRFPPYLAAADDRAFGQAFEIDPVTFELELDGAYITSIPVADLYPYP